MEQIIIYIGKRLYYLKFRHSIFYFLLSLFPSICSHVPNKIRFFLFKFTFKINLSFVIKPFCNRSHWENNWEETTHIKFIFHILDIIFSAISMLPLWYLCLFLKKSSNYKIKNIITNNFDSSNYGTAGLK